MAKAMTPNLGIGITTPNLQSAMEGEEPTHLAQDDNHPDLAPWEEPNYETRGTRTLHRNAQNLRELRKMATTHAGRMKGDEPT